MKTNITHIVHEVILESPLGAKTIAQAVGKPYSTLMREMNPHDSGAKLGIETLLRIMKVTGNVMPLEQMAREMGYSLQEVSERGCTSVESTLH